MLHILPPPRPLSPLYLCSLGEEMSHKFHVLVQVLPAQGSSRRISVRDRAESAARSAGPQDTSVKGSSCELNARGIWLQVPDEGWTMCPLSGLAGRKASAVDASSHSATQAIAFNPSPVMAELDSRMWFQRVPLFTHSTPPRGHSDTVCQQPFSGY